MEKNKTSVIVVGGGIAGISCAIILARANKDVILVERGDFSGAKNMFGGEIYTQPTKEIFPNFESEAPLERKTVKNNYLILSENSSTNISHENKNENNAYTVIRAKFDRWMLEEAKKCGVIFAPNTCVRELIIENKKVIGIKTDMEEYFADVVVLADGVNSLLAKQINLRKPFKPKDFALSVKEVLNLPKEVIEQRFNLTNNGTNSVDDGAMYEIFGFPMSQTVGLGFIYTNKTSVSVGLGISLEDLIKNELNPAELLDKLKTHPSVQPLIKDGELLEYSAHLIPEGGYKNLPKLYADGVLVIGDAAGLINNLHFEGTNLAMLSGKFAAETIINAIDKNNFSKKILKNYEKKLKKSFIIKDLKTYANLLPIMNLRKKSFMGFYLDEINNFFDNFIKVDGKPKKLMYQNFIKSFFKKQNPIEFCKDFIALIKILWRILF